ncbi:MAG: Spo0B domain-containing protein [Bacillota bacterium]
MDTATFLEIMSVQRHDFLNHLQVISGLVQLNKVERVREYISQVSMEVERLSKVGHLNIPEVAAVLLTGHFWAGKHQVEVVYDISTNFDHCTVPGKILGEVVEEVFWQSLKCLVPPGVPDRTLKISLAETEKKYLLKFFSPGPPGREAETAQDRLAGIGSRLVPYHGKVGIVVSGAGGEIFIVLPKKAPDGGQGGA